MSMLAYSASLLGGMVPGMMVGDALGSIPQVAAAPATSASAKPKVVGGEPVATVQSGRASLNLGVFIVVGALAFLLLGSRVLKDARIG